MTILHSERFTVARYHLALAGAAFLGGLRRLLRGDKSDFEDCTHPDGSIDVVVSRRGREIAATAYCTNCRYTFRTARVSL